MRGGVPLPAPAAYPLSNADSIKNALFGLLGPEANRSDELEQRWLLYSGFLRGLHFTMGSTTPTDRQLGWTFAAWLISLLAIVDALVLTLRFL
jgi:hypothetical protein